MKHKYARGFLTPEEVMAILGIFTDEDLKCLKQTRLYRHWEETGRIEYANDKQIRKKPAEGIEPPTPSSFG